MNFPFLLMFRDQQSTDRLNGSSEAEGVEGGVGNCGVGEWSSWWSHFRNREWDLTNCKKCRMEVYKEKASKGVTGGGIVSPSEDLHRVIKIFIFCCWPWSVTVTHLLRLTSLREMHRVPIAFNLSQYTEQPSNLIDCNAETLFKLFAKSNEITEEECVRSRCSRHSAPLKSEVKPLWVKFWQLNASRFYREENMFLKKVKSQKSTTDKMEIKICIF